MSNETKVLKQREGELVRKILGVVDLHSGEFKMDFTTRRILNEWKLTPFPFLIGYPIK